MTYYSCVALRFIVYSYIRLKDGSITTDRDLTIANTKADKPQCTTAYMYLMQVIPETRHAQ